MWLPFGTVVVSQFFWISLHLTDAKFVKNVTSKTLYGRVAGQRQREAYDIEGEVEIYD